MLSLLLVAFLLFLSILLLTYFTGWLIPEGSSGVTEVRMTPEREIKEMTVSGFKDLARDYLSSEGFEVESNGEELRARKDEERFYVQFDFEAKASNPREINGMVVEQKKRDSDRLILFTLATVDGQARKLADRSRIRIVEPETIIRWKRERGHS